MNALGELDALSMKILVGKTPSRYAACQLHMPYSVGVHVTFRLQRPEGLDSRTCFTRQLSIGQQCCAAGEDEIHTTLRVERLPVRVVQEIERLRQRSEEKTLSRWRICVADF